MSLSSLSSVPTRVLAGALVVGAVVTAGVLVSPTATVEAVESLAADPFPFGAAVAGLYLVRPLFAWPTTPLAVVVGYGYGVAMGVPIALAGVVVTVTPVFLAARFAVDDDAETSTSVVQSSGTGGGTDTDVDPAIETDIDTVTDTDTETDTESIIETSSADSLLERTNAVVSRYYETAGPIRGVTASRLAPIPSDVSTCAAAASGVRLRHLVLGTILGELPWTIAAVVVGASAATVTTGGLGELGLALPIACCLAAALLLAGPAYRAVRTHTQAQHVDRPADS